MTITFVNESLVAHLELEVVRDLFLAGSGTRLFLEPGQCSPLTEDNVLILIMVLIVAKP